MVANKINLKIFWFSVVFVLSFSVFANIKISDKALVNFLHKNIAKSTVKLGNRIELCEKLRLNSDTVLLNVEKLKILNANNNDVIIALTHISFNNSFNCEKSARMKLAYDLGILISVKRQSQLKTKDLNEVEDNLIYPSVKQIRLSVEYLKLSAKLRKYIEEAIGDKPFNLIKTLKTNHLLDI